MACGNWPNELASHREQLSSMGNVRVLAGGKTARGLCSSAPEACVGGCELIILQLHVVVAADPVATSMRESNQANVKVYVYTYMYVL